MITKSIVIVLFFGVLTKGADWPRARCGIFRQPATTTQLPEVPQCGPNEVYFTCGTGCPPTCENQNPQVCNTACTKGCFCRVGFVKNAAGKCVPPASCPSPKAAPGVCTIANEEYQECGTQCPKTCTNQDPGLCPTGCVKGCFCKEGFYRNDTGTCITKDKCPSLSLQHTCRSDEVWNSCGTDCEASCKDKEPTCDKKCKPGCFCKEGTIRKDKSADAACVTQC